MRAPGFWRRGEGGMASALLRPLGWLYDVGGQINQAAGVSVKAPVPVICVGNVVAGGAGKTPVAIAIGQRLHAAGVGLHYLSRGYGGSESGPHRVDASVDAASRVGDEPLLLARVAPTWVARDRVQGAASIVDAGGQVIVMDDGLQNGALVKDMSFCVIDGSYGIGNGRVIPAGPLRESLENALKKSTAVVLVGDDTAGITGIVSQLSPEMPILNARLKADITGFDPTARPLHAFAGIAQPEKFFTTLRGLGCDLKKTTSFADHHPFSDDELARLVADAQADKALLLTTEKDYVRLEPDWQDAVMALHVAIEWQDEGRLDTLLNPLFFESA
ncbi:MAG: tetraacyldisaccharide 4'-kinase [Rhodospirillales bacterium]|nr:tetraacyldisaccharide 4'-kinase [Rhodospirillales bacterium]